VVLLDDGLDYESDDLKDNFVSLDSTLLSYTNTLPTPALLTLFIPPLSLTVC
jgi:hypothetical protein